MKTIKKYLKLSRKDLLYLLLWQLAGFAMGVIMVLLINAFLNKDPDYAPMGTLFGAMFTFVGGLLRGNLGTKTRLGLAVAMGQTRRSFLLWDTLLECLIFALGLLSCRLLAWGELGLYALLYPGFENGLPLDTIFTWPVLLLLEAGMVSVNLFFSMLHARFGAKAYSFMWLGVWVLGMLFSQSVSAAEDGRGGILALAGRGFIALAGLLNWQGWLAVGLAFLAALAAGGVAGLYKAEVKL